MATRHRRAGRVTDHLLAIAAAGGAVGALLVAVEAGLDRLGIGLAPANSGGVPHGAVMVGGFVGTLVALERARASDQPLASLVPFASAAGAAFLILGWPAAGQLLQVLAAAGLALLMWSFWRLQPQLPLALVAAGAIVWAGGTVVWVASGSPVRAVPWWMVFLVFTILGERLELTRFARRPTAPAIAAALVLVGGLVTSLINWRGGAHVVGIGMTLAGTWLLWADTARATVRRGGLATYAGAALITAYAWLAVAGVIVMLRGLLNPWYDATLHAFFIGFVIGSIFAHGPIILPALTGRAVRFTPMFLLALVLLHASVGLRVAASLASEQNWRQQAAHAHVLAFVAYVAAMALGLLLERRRSIAGTPVG